MKKIILKIQSCLGIVPKPILEKKIAPYKLGYGDHTCQVCKTKYTHNVDSWDGTCSHKCKNNLPKNNLCKCEVCKNTFASQYKQHEILLGCCSGICRMKHPDVQKYWPIPIPIINR